jgi:glyoxylase-like metal-dependent hydrolase (beta-lactamase superfamily II)
MMQVTLVPVTPFQQNCAVLRCSETGQGAIVDPGGDLERILAVVERDGILVQKILLTHGHLDHAGGATELAERLGVQIIGPQADDQFWLDSMAQQAQMFGVGGARVVLPDQYLVDGDVVGFGEVSLEVLHCPGHTPGHVAFFDPESRVAIVGDLLFRGSIGRTDFPRGDYDTLIRSLTQRLLPLGDDVRFHCGHGPGSTLGEERRTNPFLLDPDRFRGMV